MKTFHRHRDIDEIRLLCRDLGIPLNDRLYRTAGWDTVVVGCHAHQMREPGAAYVIYNTFNGTFFGKTAKGEEFDSSSTTHEDEPWFQQLLELFYVEKKAPAEQRDGVPA